MQALTRDDYKAIFSDTYKEANGFRPRFDTSAWSIQDFENEMGYLETVIESNLERENSIQQESIRVFEALVTKTINTGANTRETAIRWILDGDTDIEHFEWKNNLPFGYLKSI